MDTKKQIKKILKVDASQEAEFDAVYDTVINASKAVVGGVACVGLYLVRIFG